jgi:hypothetical protein
MSTDKKGGVKYDGTRCSVNDFSERMKFEDSQYKPSKNQIELIKQLSLQDIETINDVDNSEYHEWYEVGNEKYGRRMYCPMTNTARSTTMGEFYQSTTVD